MKPLLFVNWRRVNRLFCGLMWALALVLAVLILSHAVQDSATVHHVGRYVR